MSDIVYDKVIENHVLVILSVMNVTFILVVIR